MSMGNPEVYVRVCCWPRGGALYFIFFWKKVYIFCVLPPGLGLCPMENGFVFGCKLPGGIPKSECFFFVDFLPDVFLCNVAVSTAFFSASSTRGKFDFDQEPCFFFIPPFFALRGSIFFIYNSIERHRPIPYGSFFFW